MRVPLLSKDGDFAGNVNIKITRPSTGGFNVTLLSAESLRDTAVLTSIQGQVDWPLFHIGGALLVAYFVLGERHAMPHSAVPKQLPNGPIIIGC